MKNKTLPILFLIILAFSFFISGCKKVDNVNNSDENEKPVILVSILPQKEFVTSITGDLFEVKELIHPGESPATYSLIPQDLSLIENAFVYFRIGYIPFEKSNLKKIEETNKNLVIVDSSENVDLRYFGEQGDGFKDGTLNQHNFDQHEDRSFDKHDGDHDHEEGAIDPHIWLSPEQVKKQVNTIYQTMIELDPENNQIYTKNRDVYLAKLKILQEKINNELDNIKGKKMLVFHPSWGYFAEEFGLEQIAVEQDGKEPTVDQIKEIIDLINDNDISVIFVQEQFSTKSAEAIAEETGIRVVQIDPLAENYLGNMEEIAVMLKDGLNN